MQNSRLLDSFTPAPCLLLVSALLLAPLAAAHAAVPYSSATVTRVENKVSYGQVRGGRSETRLASPRDVVRASDFLLSESESRAELKYEDGTIVRIGQNTVFSFDAKTRTLKLDKGTLVFYIPKGAGGATIKTPSITAAITGTTGKVSVNTIAIVEGQVTLKPDGQTVGQFQFARANADGTITIGFYDPAKAYDGLLMTFGGRIEGLPDLPVGTEFRFTPPIDDAFSKTQNLPNTVQQNNPTAPEMKQEDAEVKPPPVVDPPPPVKKHTLVPPNAPLPPCS